MNLLLHGHTNIPSRISNIHTEYLTIKNGFYQLLTLVTARNNICVTILKINAAYSPNVTIYKLTVAPTLPYIRQNNFQDYKIKSINS